MGQEFDGKILGEAFAGYVFRLTGGNDKQGFQMKQGIMSNTRVRILFKKRKSYIFPLVSCSSPMFNNYNCYLTKSI
jgi:small subunit ribosomal protein S6e